jgi:hypothetical protein
MEIGISPVPGRFTGDLRTPALVQASALASGPTSFHQAGPTCCGALHAIPSSEESDSALVALSRLIVPPPTCLPMV